MKNKKIGIFDSGIGGLSILKELIKILPNESYLFYEDSIHNPYGEKTEEELFSITSNIVDYLIYNDCKLIVIACNTATTSCMKKLQEKYPNMIFVGTVPAIKIAYDENYKNTILLATPYTIQSSRVEELIHDYQNTNQNIYLVSGQNLANLIDSGRQDKINLLLDEILSPYAEKADSIVLGCTHYPLIKKNIEQILPNCKVLDGSIGVANEVLHQLELNNIKSNSKKKQSIIIKNTKSDDLVKRSYEILKDMLK